MLHVIAVQPHGPEVAGMVKARNISEDGHPSHCWLCGVSRRGCVVGSLWLFNPRNQSLMMNDLPVYLTKSQRVVRTGSTRAVLANWSVCFSVPSTQCMPTGFCVGWLVHTREDPQGRPSISHGGGASWEGGGPAFSKQTIDEDIAAQLQSITHPLAHSLTHVFMPSSLILEKFESGVFFFLLYALIFFSILLVFSIRLFFSSAFFVFFFYPLRIEHVLARFPFLFCISCFERSNGSSDLK